MARHDRLTPIAALSLILGLACGDDGEATTATTASSTATSTATASTSTSASTNATSTSADLSTDTAVESTGDTSTTSEGTSTTTDGTTSTGSTSADTTTGDDSTTGAVDLCAPAGNLIEHGGLDEGVNGDAPIGWEVRNPMILGDCAPSGPHLFVVDPAPGCGGGAIRIDANDAWDCVAVQTVSPYNSVEGGATYEIRATVRSTGNAVNPAAWFVLGAQWLDENDSFFGDEKNPKPASAAENDYEWKVLTWEVVAPANARRILVWLSAHYPGEVEYDHVAVIKKG